MKVHHRHSAPIHAPTTNASTQSANAQASRRRRMGQAIEPGEAHHSAELEELLLVHQQHPTTIRRKSTSRRKGDIENPEESQGEQAQETETMVLCAYARDTKNLVIKVSSRQGGGQQGESQSNRDSQQDGRSIARRKVGNATLARAATQETSPAFAEAAARADLPRTQAQLLQLARAARSADSVLDPIDRAMALMQLYLAHCAQRRAYHAPRATLADIREQLIEALKHEALPPAATGLARSPKQISQIERFNLFLPLWLLQLHRPRLADHRGPALARSHVMAACRGHLAV
ncbi:hypothetical protein [Paraburkholderia bannensis]|uniref:hypothetical protein n=1 Tax=Paraburkholderia bannensis TaxID=765414 RepID=UPI002ABDA101|nr:hypothetical protein [Paraburkholderia bannensis]